MELNIETNDFDEYYKSLCEKVLFPLLNKLADNIKSLKYFVIGSSDTNVFVKTIAKYSSKLHTESYSENNEQYQVAAKTIEGTDENGTYHQAIIVKSGLVIGLFSDLYSLNEIETYNACYDNIRWLGLTTIIHEIGHAIDNEYIYKITNSVNTRSAFDLSNPYDRKQYIFLSCISIWSEFFAESFVFDSFPMLCNKLNNHFNNLVECCDNYYGENIQCTDRIYRIIYFFVHLLAQEGTACYEKLLDKNLSLHIYEEYLINMGNELLRLKEIYPNWNTEKDLKSLENCYISIHNFERLRWEEI